MFERKCQLFTTHVTCFSLCDQLTRWIGTVNFLPTRSQENMASYSTILYQFVVITYIYTHVCYNSICGIGISLDTMINKLRQTKKNNMDVNGAYFSFV